MDAIQGGGGPGISDAKQKTKLRSFFYLRSNSFNDHFPPLYPVESEEEMELPVSITASSRNNNNNANTHETEASFLT